MWIFTFYRFYIALACGISGALFLVKHWWFGLLVTVSVRALIALFEMVSERYRIEKSFKLHASPFKQELGPYGIRMINRAEKELKLRKSLAEVFVKSEAKLKKAVEQLDMMETLYKAGMQPDADTWQIHDLKLKYGRFRIAEIEKTKVASSKSTSA